MTTWTFPAAGGTLWDDLWEDEPWRDYALEADREQDEAEAYAMKLRDPAARAELAAVILRERYRACDLITAAVDVVLEQYAPPPAPATPFAEATRRYRDDSQLTTARRRRALVAALADENREGAA